MTERRALYAGSFDPVTRGHYAVICNALNLFDELVIGIGVNPEKKAMFNTEQRSRWIAKALSKHPRKDCVTVVAFEGLTVERAEELNCDYLVRGVRGIDDVGQEMILMQVNDRIRPNIQTVWIPKADITSSNIVRQLIFSGAANWRELITDYVPEEIKEGIIEQIENPPGALGIKGQFNAQ